MKRVEEKIKKFLLEKAGSEVTIQEILEATGVSRISIKKYLDEMGFKSEKRGTKLYYSIEPREKVEETIQNIQEEEIKKNVDMEITDGEIKRTTLERVEFLQSIYIKGFSDGYMEGFRVGKGVYGEIFEKMKLISDLPDGKQS